MSINKLQINDLRNIESAQFALDKHINIFYGDNGSGKTTVLESIHLLSSAKSFKVSRTRSLIRFGQTEAVVYCQVDGLPIGLSRRKDGKHLVKVGGEPVKSSAELAELLPVQLIHADSFNLLEGTPSHRRQFLDWGVFHVEHSFFNQWQRLQKCLKNRNSLLRSGTITPSLMAPWDTEMIEAAEAIDQMRQQYLKGFVPHFEKVLSSLTNIEDLKLHYTRGWDKNKSFQQALADGLARDSKSGFTNYGPQRADFKIKVNGVLAADVLSRGQQKLVVCALKLAQGFYMAEQQGRPSIFLIDDLPAELDSKHIKKMCELLEQMDVQVFITCIDKKQLEQCWAKHKPALFHVEHGQITAQPNGVNE